MRILAIDPGEKRIGIALSDPTGTIANPLTVLTHVERSVDAGSIAELAQKNGVELIIIGQVMDEDGTPGFQSRKAVRLAEAIKSIISIRVELWDESGSTQEAKQARVAMRAPRNMRRGHLDEMAATVILQSYLNSILDR